MAATEPRRLRKKSYLSLPPLGIAAFPPGRRNDRHAGERPASRTITAWMVKLSDGNEDRGARAKKSRLGICRRCGPRTLAAAGWKIFLENNSTLQSPEI